MLKKKIIIITNDFPFGKEEVTFIKPELYYLLNKFNVAIISMSNSDEKTTNLNENINLYHIKRRFNLLSKIKYIIKYFMRKECIEEVRQIILLKKLLIPRIRDSIGYFGCAEVLYEQIKKQRIFEKEKPDIVYSYWCNENCLAVLLHKSEYSHIRIVSRIHGYDLYEERNIFGRQPFRSLINSRIDKLFFLSEEAIKYYINTWKDIKISLCEIYKMGIINQYDVKKLKETNVFHLVSCSHLIPLKRVELIVEALFLIYDIKIKWVHFGTGEEEYNIQRRAENLFKDKINISYKLMGYRTNQDIMKFYAENYIDCFITTSESEGCPVSIQEALSFGIPVIGTDTGAIGSMIKNCGILLPLKITAQDVADAITQMSSFNNTEIKELRKNAYSVWKENYNGEINYNSFAERLSLLVEND